MNKNFTKEDIIKKYETNIKSAQGGFALAGVLGFIYIVRYFFKGDFEFYFSLSVPEMMLKLSHWGEIGKVPAYAVTGIFVAVYFALTVLISKKTEWLKGCLVLYVADFICLLVFISAFMSKPIDSAVYIEVVVHCFLILFLGVGVYSERKLKNIKG